MPANQSGDSSPFQVVLDRIRLSLAFLLIPRTRQSGAELREPRMTDKTTDFGNPVASEKHQKADRPFTRRRCLSINIVENVQSPSSPIP
jgi:hypothetical protein